MGDNTACCSAASASLPALFIFLRSPQLPLLQCLPNLLTLWPWLVSGLSGPHPWHPQRLCHSIPLLCWFGSKLVPYAALSAAGQQTQTPVVVNPARESGQDNRSAACTKPGTLLLVPPPAWVVGESCSWVTRNTPGTPCEPKATSVSLSSELCCASFSTLQSTARTGL